MEKVYGVYWPEEMFIGNPLEEDNEYLLIYGLERSILNYATSMTREQKGDLEAVWHLSSDWEYAIEYMFNQAKQFGVNLPEPQEGKHIVCAESLAWYKFNVDYFWKVLNHGQTDHLGSYIIRPLIDQGMDISYYMPEGDWHDLLDKEYYLFEILLGHDLSDLKEKAISENRIEDLANAYYKLNNMDLESIAAEYGPTPYVTNLFKNNYRPYDEELDRIVQESIINKPKIHGEYCPNNVFYDSQQVHIKYMSAPELYNTIRHLNEHKKNYHEDFYWLDEFSAEDELYAKEFLMYQTKRFGVEFPDNDENEPLEETPSYNAWYEFYDNYFSSFSEEQRDSMIYDISVMRAAKVDYSRFLPEGNWYDSLNNEIIKK